MPNEKKPFYQMTVREWFGLIKNMMLWGLAFAVIASGYVFFSKPEDWELYIVNIAVAAFCVGLTTSVSALSEDHSKLWTLGFPLGFCSWMICSFIFGVNFTVGENIAAAIGCGFVAMLIHFLPEDDYS